MITSVVFDPLFPLWMLAAFGAAAIVMLLLAIWRGLPGWIWRAFSLAALGAALANPLLQRENRSPHPDVAIVVVDQTTSSTLSDRAAQTARADAALQSALAALPGGVELDLSYLPDQGNDGSRLETALAEALGRHDPNRVAAIFAITDGRLHDTGALQTLPAPLHMLQTGHASDWDRRVLIENAPAYGIVGEDVEVMLRIEDTGAAPGDTTTPIYATINGGDVIRLNDLPVNASNPLTLNLRHAGVNVLELWTPGVDGELTEANNRVILQVTGVRDRLRVLLVSGEPYAGERTWRNLLKADPAVDLVHFTILRSPEKQDGVPYTELSLIAFPTNELFMEKLDEFDLVIFDRFRRQGVLPDLYLQNIARYVQAGGALLVADADGYAGPDSLYRTPLREVLPAAPTGQMFTEAFQPTLSDLGARHPVTQGLDAWPGLVENPDGPSWGHWFRQVELLPQIGYTLMNGANESALLQLARVGNGRVALLGSDQVWLWARGYEGGGPQAELLRRLSHWLMREPELEENVLTATANGPQVTVTRTMLEGEPGPVTITSPGGGEQELTLREIAPGRYQGQFAAPESGIYRLMEGELVAVVATGPAAPREYDQPVATPDLLAVHILASGGGVFLIEDGIPSLRRVADGRQTTGRGWAGLVERNAYTVTDLRQSPLAPGWIWLVLAAGFALVAWRREGR